MTYRAASRPRFMMMNHDDDIEEPLRAPSDLSHTDLTTLRLSLILKYLDMMI